MVFIQIVRQEVNAYNSIASERSWHLQTRTGRSTEALKKTDVYLPSTAHQYIIVCFSWQ